MTPNKLEKSLVCFFLTYRKVLTCVCFGFQQLLSESHSETLKRNSVPNRILEMDNC